MIVVPVDLGKRSYDIEIGIDLLKDIGSKLSQFPVGKQVALITDENVDQYYGEIVEQSLKQHEFTVEKIVIPPGEHSKSWNMAGDILEVLLTKKFNRDATVVALGGGVVGDLAGFVASVYQRGIHFVQIPTTLLAQVDSSVGGKVAVNHSLGKNMIGSFYQPLVVWIDVDTLHTLPQRQWAAGLGEVVKYGVIQSAEFFQFLVGNKEAIKKRDYPVVKEIIATCCRIKAQVVATDEQDRGIRAILNFGHTIGHGLEQATNYEGYLHGEAVAIGMVLAYQLAQDTGFCQDNGDRELKELLAYFELPTELDLSLNQDEIIDAMLIDKKIDKGQLVFILPKVFGEVESVKNISVDEVRNFLRKLGE